LKILICCESEIVLQMAGMALEGAGHQVALDRDPVALVPQVAGASALMVDAARARQAVALLRDRGFSGRALLVGTGNPEELKKQAEGLGVDGVVPFEPPDEIPKRLQAALGGRELATDLDVWEAGKDLLRAGRSKAVLITRGEEGMTLVERGRDACFHIPAFARQVFDVTGAGDTVIGTLAACLAAGATMREAAVLANVAASVVVGEVGTAQITAEKLLRAAELLIGEQEVRRSRRRRGGAPLPD